MTMKKYILISSDIRKKILEGVYPVSYKHQWMRKNKKMQKKEVG